MKLTSPNASDGRKSGSAHDLEGELVRDEVLTAFPSQCRRVKRANTSW